MAAPATAKPLLAEDIGVAAFPDVPYESPLRALCKPAFAPLDTQMFVSGTEEPSADGDGKNHIVFGRIDFKSKRTEVLEDGRPAIWTTPVPGQVRDVAWLTADHAVGALGDQLGIIHFKHDGAHSSSSEIALLPRVHGDTIRELAVNPTRPHLILSASFDGTCILSDLLQVSAAREAKSALEFVKFGGGPACGPAGSVSWRNGDTFTGAVTYDTGSLHVFDIRTELKRPAIRFSAEREMLYSHAFMDSYKVMLGFGDGYLQLHDLRKQGVILVANDPYQTSVGDIRCQVNPTGLTVVTCGHPGLSVWAYRCSLGGSGTEVAGTSAKPELAVASHHRAAGIDFASKPAYKISGAFVPHTSYFAASDSLGSMLVLDTEDVYLPIL